MIKTLESYYRNRGHFFITITKDKIRIRKIKNLEGITLNGYLSGVLLLKACLAL